MTGIGCSRAFRAIEPNRKWGQVVGTIGSEWRQILGLVSMARRWMEVGSKQR
jgi:hypothetical protein